MPVCGCDDKTYGNQCTAAAAGVSVAKSGECTTDTASGATSPDVTSLGEGQLCGTRGVPGECGDGLYCAYRQNCGADDSGGTCSKKALGCRNILKPVCGCDNKTYGNECMAARAGVSVAKSGECRP